MLTVAQDTLSTVLTTDRAGNWVGSLADLTIREAEVAGLRLIGARNIVIEDSTFTEADLGLTLIRCQTITLRRCKFAGLKVGVKVDLCKGVLIEDCEFTRIVKDGIFSAGSSDLIYRRNTFHGFTPDEKAHPDAIQFANPTLARPPCEGIEVADNSITGTLQGIFGRARNIAIRRNRVTIAFANGIAFPTCEGVTCEDNEVRTVGTARDQARFNMIGASVTWLGKNAAAAHRNKPALVY